MFILKNLFKFVTYIFDVYKFFVIINPLQMKKQNTIFSAFLSKITSSKKNDFSSKKYQNYTSLVNNFKTRFELD